MRCSTRLGEKPDWVNALTVVTFLADRGHTPGAAVRAVEWLVDQRLLEQKIQWTLDDCATRRAAAMVVGIDGEARRAVALNPLRPSSVSGSRESRYPPEPLVVLVRPTTRLERWWLGLRAGSPSPPAVTVVVDPPVKLNEKDHSAIVLGVRKDGLTDARFAVIQALLKVWPEGLSKDQLVRQSGHDDAVNVLKRLAKSDQDWGKVIQLPGKPGRKYRLLSSGY
jgi:hypothetical protein